MSEMIKLNLNAHDTVIAAMQKWIADNVDCDHVQSIETNCGQLWLTMADGSVLSPSITECDPIKPPPPEPRDLAWKCPQCGDDTLVQYAENTIVAVPVAGTDGSGLILRYDKEYCIGDTEISYGCPSCPYRLDSAYEPDVIKELAPYLKVPGATR